MSLDWALGAAVIAGAFFVLGLAGFGNGLVALAFLPLVMSPAEFDTYLRGDIDKWAKVIQTAGIKVQ